MASELSQLLRKLRFGRPIIVVSGLPRSGTSMAMNMLEAGGLDVTTDGVRSPDEDNPKGYYEDDRVKDLAKMEDRSWLRRSRGRAIKVISFLLKDLPADNNYKIIFMERKLSEVLRSQQKMLENREEASGPEDQQMREVYTEHLRHVRFMVGYRRHLDALFVSYSEVLDDPEPHARRIDAFLGGGLDWQAMAEVVDPSLYRNRA